MKLAIDGWSFRHSLKRGPDAVARAVRRAVELGAEGVLFDYFTLPGELCVDPGRMLSLQSEFRLEYALGCGAPIALPAVLWRASRDRRQSAFELARTLGAKVVRFPLSLMSPVSWTPLSSLAMGPWYVERALAPRLRRMCEKAAPRGLTIAIENDGAFRSETLLRLLELVDRPNLGASLAIGAFVAQGEDPYRATERLAPHAALVVLSDMVGAGVTARGATLGEGRIDLGEILRLLRRAGYHGLAAVRVDTPRRDAERADQRVQRSFVHLTQLRDALEKEDER